VSPAWPVAGRLAVRQPQDAALCRVAERATCPGPPDLQTGVELPPGRRMAQHAGCRRYQWVRSRDARARPRAAGRALARGTARACRRRSGRRQRRAESADACDDFFCSLYASGMVGAGGKLRQGRCGAAARPVQAFRHSGELGGAPPGHARRPRAPPNGGAGGMRHGRRPPDDAGHLPSPGRSRRRTGRAPTGGRRHEGIGPPRTERTSCLIPDLSALGRHPLRAVATAPWGGLARGPRAGTGFAPSRSDGTRALGRRTGTKGAGSLPFPCLRSWKTARGTRGTCATASAARCRRGFRLSLWCGRAL
jgi:hypothetical protein